MCCVVNAWQFSSVRDTTGSEVTGPTSLNRIQCSAETTYFADNESGSWRSVFSFTNIIGGDELNDAWSPTHLSYGASSRTLSGELRVEAKRHGEGANLMFFDGHASWQAGSRMRVDDWREQKR